MRTLPLLLLCACATAMPPPARVADQVDVEQIQVGWIQVPTGQPNRPIVEDLRHGRAPDEVEAKETAQRLLDQCEKGAAIEPLQKQYSEVEPGVVSVDGSSRLPFRDLALSLKPGDCALYRSNIAFHVIKRVR